MIQLTPQAIQGLLAILQTLSPDYDTVDQAQLDADWDRRELIECLQWATHKLSLRNRKDSSEDIEPILIDLARPPTLTPDSDPQPCCDQGYHFEPGQCPCQHSRPSTA